MKLPALTGDFSLIPLWKRLQWRDALSRYLLQQSREKDGLLPKWKIDEQVAPMNLVLAGLLKQGDSNPRTTLEKRLGLDEASRSEHATSK